MLRAVTSLFVSRPGMTVTLWAAVLAFGVLSYGYFLPREGFPSVDVPVAVASGPYLVDDADRVDAEVAQPLVEALLEEDSVESVVSFSLESGFSIVANFESGTSSGGGVEIIEGVVADLDLPSEATVNTTALDAARFLNEYDLLVGVLAGPDTTAEELEEAAAALLPSLEAEPEIVSAAVEELITRGIDPATGEPASLETDFNLLTTETDGGLEYRPSIAVGVIADSGVDSLGIRDATDRGLDRAEADQVLPEGFEAIVAIDFATQIRDQVGSLQNNVMTGVIAVALIALVILASARASLVTGMFIVTVLATSFGVLFLVGISLNTISLFGVILALGLFVDDAIVITESIVASQTTGAYRNNPDSAGRPEYLAIIRHAIGRVGSASLSGTLTTLLVFAPMLAISGILGDFIRILPISVIVALSVSVVLSFVFIPLAARYLILTREPREGPITRAEAWLADRVAGLPAATGAQGLIRGLLAVALAVTMTAVGLLVFAPRVGFNIFPASKDSTEIGVEIAYPPGTPVDDARRIAVEVNQAAADALGDDLERGYTYLGNSSGATGQLSLTDLGTRDPAPQIVDEVLTPLGDSFTEARVTFTQISPGPPELIFPFQAQLFSEEFDSLAPGAQVIADDLEGRVLTRDNGTTFTVIETEVALTDSVARIDGERYVEIRARYDADDVTTITQVTQEYLEGTYGEADLADLGLADDARFEFDLGLESDNQESFSSLPIAFGLALLSMMVLLIIQFRSAVQWLLVFLAIPFSFFGVFGGLLLTNNVISFFVMLGLIGLIGIAVNNTILLVDYANQERAAGHDRREAIRNAVRARFRPLVATSLTTVAGLLPLALSDPFWEALGMTIIFGLLSSTFLVIVSFPFFYLGVEALRDRFVTPWRRGRGPGSTEPIDDTPSGDDTPDADLTPVGVD